MQLCNQQQNTSLMLKNFKKINLYFFLKEIRDPWFLIQNLLQGIDLGSIPVLFGIFQLPHLDREILSFLLHLTTVNIMYLPVCIANLSI